MGRADPAESSMSGAVGRGPERAAEWIEPVGLRRGERIEGSAETRARRSGEGAEEEEEEENEVEEERRERVEARAASMKAISSSLTISTGTGM